MRAEARGSRGEQAPAVPKVEKSGCCPAGDTAGGSDGGAGDAECGKRYGSAELRGKEEERSTDIAADGEKRQRQCAGRTEKTAEELLTAWKEEKPVVPEAGGTEEVPRARKKKGRLFPVVQLWRRRGSAAGWMLRKKEETLSSDVRKRRGNTPECEEAGGKPESTAKE